jgi:hypothetical protein
MKIAGVAQIRELERRADAAGVSFAQTMERAGRIYIAPPDAQRENGKVRTETALHLTSAADRI